MEDRNQYLKDYLRPFDGAAGKSITERKPI